MSHDDIVPSILPDVPPLKIAINYPGGKSVDLGTDLTPAEVGTAPEVTWSAAPDKYYTLYMFDPDAPSQNWAFLGDVVHWLVVNIRGSDLATGETVAEYRGAGPPRGTGAHRYIFLVFEHQEAVSEGKMGGIRQRVRFSTKRFREKFDGVHAWNYFKARWSREVNQEARKCVVA